MSLKNPVDLLKQDNPCKTQIVKYIVNVKLNNM